MYGAEVWQIPTREMNKILSTEMHVLRMLARKSSIERIRNEHIKESQLILYQKHKFMIQTFQSFDTQEAPFVRLSRVGCAMTIPHKIPTIVCNHMCIPSSFLSGFDCFYVLVKSFTLLFA